ncbi:hypothetical protein LIER_11121 [Lithospermum erythrorhizon]|uniref:F-box domain-containing protein n=1 Tax=Lithospermum erythrorhizon TaxID=34254 RepID=A0AAV3PN43_LITER
MAYEMFSTLYCKLPGEVMIDILSRVPIKPLLKFKTVSKSWNALITDPLFISMHVDRSAMFEDESLLLLHRHDNNHSTFLYSLSNAEKFKILDMPRIPYDEGFWIVGCLNGLLCLTTRNNLFNTNYFLFNPALREFSPLPQHQSTLAKFDKIELVSVGFGYDSRTKDYKMVRLEYYTLSHLHFANADVYTLSTDSWKQINVTSRVYVREMICKVFVKGTLHWTADQGDNERCIVTYDVENETFGNLPLPNIPHIADEIYWEVHVCQELLAIAYCYRQGNNLRFDIWVMDEYGVGQSWKKQFTVGPHSDFAVLLGISNSCELLFYNSYYFFVSVFDPTSNKTRHIDIPGSFGSLEVADYRKSLVTVKRKHHVKRDFNSWKHYDLQFLLFVLLVCLAAYLISSSIKDFIF